MIPLPDETRKLVEKQSSQFYKVLKNSLKLNGENILIICDYGNKNNLLAPMMAHGYQHICQQKGLSTQVLVQDVKKGFMQMEDHITRALSTLNPGSLIIVATSNKIGRIGEIKSFRSFCKEQGHRFLSATGLGDVESVHFDLFLEAMNVNYRRMKKKGMAIKKLWDKAQEIRVRTEAGTDLAFNVAGMDAVANVGEYHEPGSGGNMPAGEVYIPPKGMTGVNGQVVIDGSIKTERGAVLVQEPLLIVIEQGKVVRMEGTHAEIMEQTFQKFEDRAKHPERIRLVSELGIGINPAAVLIGSTILDEKALGTAHIAFGSNYWFGGEIKTIFHGDMVFKSPTFYIDGKKMEL